MMESNHILSLHLIVTSRLGIYSSDTERITLVKLIHALSISDSLLIKASNDIPPIQDPKNNDCLSYEGKDKADVLNKYFCSITNLVDENKTLPDSISFTIYSFKFVQIFIYISINFFF
jgi:hypothetical protein